MLIAAIAVIHIFVAMYAVGGGIFLAFETSYAYKTENDDLLLYLKKHAWFFILLTVVFGAITGVGIWWIIGLASPLATEELIHIFVFGWATEYVMFILEIVSAFIFFYFWGRIPEKSHKMIGWIYAVSAWLSLFLITGIISFQLNPGSYIEFGGFWRGFFNPQFFPQLFARTGGSLLLASLYVFLHASFTLSVNKPLLELIGRHTAKWAIAGGVITLIGGIGWLAMLPPSGAAALQRAPSLNILMVLTISIAVVVIVTMYFVPLKNPSWLTPGFALLFFLFGLGAVGSGEFLREATRKPFIIYNIVLGNGIYTSEIPTTKQEGFLESGVWTKAYILEKYPWLRNQFGSIDYGKILMLNIEHRKEIGRVIFQYHCNDCHAVSGYSGVKELIQGWTRPMIETLVKHPEKAQFFMPPWCGNPEEAEVLADYLESIRRPAPPGMKFGSRISTANNKTKWNVKYGSK